MRREPALEQHAAVPTADPPVPGHDPAGPAPVVGRDQQLAELTRALGAARAGHGSLVLLVGEAGSGKTRLVDELCALASRQEALVVRTGCPDDLVTPPATPWARIASALQTGLAGETGTPPQWYVDALAAFEAALARLDPAAERHDWFELFDAIHTLLAEAGRHAPVVVAVEDLQGADELSLRLLAFLAREVRTLRLLLVASYDVNRGLADPTRAHLIAAAGREGRHVRLGPLDPAAIGRLMGHALGADVGEMAADMLHRITAGNARLVSAVAASVSERLSLALLESPDSERLPLALLESPDSQRLPLSLLESPDSQRLPLALLESPDSQRLPLALLESPASIAGLPAVREAVEHQLSDLPTATRELLAEAAVLGDAFDLWLLAGLTGRAADELGDILAPAVTAALIRPARPPGRLEFAHPVTRWALELGLGPHRRAQLHRTAATTLRQRHGGDLDAPLEQLAHHWYEGFEPGEPAEALAVTLRAAEQGAVDGDHPRAARHRRHAVEMADAAGLAVSRRIDLRFALGHSQKRSGDLTQARQTFIEAATLARRAGDASRLAEAALGTAGPSTVPTAGTIDREVVHLLSEARTALGSNGDPALRSQVAGKLAIERYHEADRGERDALTAEAVELAERSEDPTVKAQALHARHFALWAVDDAEERLAAATHILQVARDAGEAELALQGRSWRVIAHLELGDATAADAEIATHAQLAAELGHPVHRWQAAVFRGCRAIMDGRFSAAAHLIEAALIVGRSSVDPLPERSSGTSPTVLHGVQQFALHRELGRLALLTGRVAELAEAYPALPAWRCALALVHVQAGRLDAAREELDRLARNSFAALPRDANWLVAATVLAEVCAAVGSSEDAAVLADQLEPYVRRTVVVAEGASWRGSVSHYLGELAASAGAPADARTHLTSAITTHDRMGSRPAAARSRSALALCLLAADARASALQIGRLLEEAATLYTDLGLEEKAAQARSQLAELPRRASARPRHEAARAQRQPPSLIYRNGTWTIVFDGTTTHLRDAKGLHHLAELLRRPGHDQHALLLDGGGRRGHEGVGAQFRERSTALRDEHARALAEGDTSGAERAAGRLAVLADSLRDAAETSEELAAEVQRARLNVTRALRGAIRKIAEHDRALGAHLEATIRTGAACSYRPDPRAGETWVVHIEGGES